MGNIIIVLQKTFEFFQVPLRFGEFTFTPFGVLIGFSLISIAVFFVREVFLDN